MDKTLEAAGIQRTTENTRAISIEAAARADRAEGEAHPEATPTIAVAAQADTRTISNAVAVVQTITISIVVAAIQSRPVFGRTGPSAATPPEGEKGPLRRINKTAIKATETLTTLTESTARAIISRKVTAHTAGTNGATTKIREYCERYYKEVFECHKCGDFQFIIVQAI